METLWQSSEARRDHEVEAALNDLPRGLDNTYARIVMRINDQPRYMRELAQNCFSWVFYARRPLSTDELQHALATKKGCKSPADLDPDEVDVIVEACGGLLIEENSRVQPIHFSVQEFFANPPPNITQDSILGRTSEPSSVHASLARTCLQYIHFGIPDHLNLELKYLWLSLHMNAFARYAAQYFDSHLLGCGNIEQDILDSIEELLHRGGSFLAALLHIRYFRDRDRFPKRYDGFSCPVSASMIIYGTHLYNVPYLRARWVSHGLPKYALHAAASAGVSNVVDLAFAQGYNIDDMDSRGNKPIHYAARGGHLPIVKALISRGANINTQGGDFGSVLQAAVIEGSMCIVDLLIRHGADLDLQGGYYGNALQAALLHGKPDIVKLLLREGADISAQGQGLYDTALQAAAGEGNSAIVELLLNEGADINAQGWRFGTALQAASAKNHDSIVELLVRRGADVNARGGDSWHNSPLQIAAMKGKRGVVELLLRRGADINAQGGYYGTALQAALASGNDSTVELLISRGADVNAQWEGSLYVVCEPFTDGCASWQNQDCGATP